MKDYDDVDDQWLKQKLAIPPLADEGFTRRATLRIARYRAFRRRIFLGGAGASAAVSAALMLALKPEAGALGEFNTALCMLVLMGLWGVCWISTQTVSGSLGVTQ